MCHSCDEYANCGGDKGHQSTGENIPLNGERVMTNTGGGTIHPDKGSP